MLKHHVLVPWILIGPTLIAFIVFFVVPIGYLFLFSFDRMDPVTYRAVEHFTLYNFKRLIFDKFYLNVFLTTFRTSFFATLVCLIAAYPVAIYLTTARRRERELLMLVLIAPLVVSVVIRTFGWFLVLGPGGVLSAMTRFAGWGPISLMYTETAVVIGLAHVSYPIMVLALYSALQNVDPNLTRAAESLGATRMQAFWRVTYPLSIPGMLAGTLIVFALSVGSFVAPSLLGGPWVKTAAFLIWEQTVIIVNWPFAAALGVVLLVITVILMMAYQRLVERRRMFISSH